MKKIVLILGILVLIFTLALLFTPSVKAAGTVTSATGGETISADNVATVTYTTLIGPTLTCGATGDIANGSTITITAPSGFNFSTTANSVTAAPTNEINLGGGAGASVTLTPTNTTITISVTTGNTTTAGASITMSGIQVIPTAGCPLASGELSVTFSAGSFGNDPTSGTLTQVPGAVNKLLITLPGQTGPDSCVGPTGTPTAQVAGTAFNITSLTATDQYFNTTTTYKGTKTIAYSGPGTCGVSPSYTTAVSFTDGVSTTLATTLVLAQVTTITATEGGSYGVASSNLTVNPAAITNLTAVGLSPGVVRLAWSVPAGCPTGYVVKYSTSDIDTQDKFNAASTFSQSWAGTATVGDVSGLVGGWNYYFAMEATGLDATQAALSNRPSTIAPAVIPDSIAPISSITLPLSGATIEAGKSYTITGTSSDTGGSSVKEVKLSLDAGLTWLAVTSKTAVGAGFTWEYVWANPVAGSYNLKTRAVDWIGNVETPGPGITITVTAPAIVPPVEEVPPEVVPSVEKPIAEMTVEELKAKIVEIQQKIVQLLQQLIQLIQAQIAELQAKLPR